MCDDLFTCELCGLCLSDCDTITLEKLPCKHIICNYCYISLSYIICPECKIEYKSIKEYDEYYNVAHDIEKFCFKYKHLLDSKVNTFLSDIYNRLYRNSSKIKNIILEKIDNNDTQQSIDIPKENLSNYSKTI